jgi:hypothetical protein
MALVLKDRVKETSTTSGTGTLTLGGAVDGFQSFSILGDGNQTYYAITAANEWEVGIGTYDQTAGSLSRDVILESSNAGAAVDFPAGEKQVFVTYPAEKASVTFPAGTRTANYTASINEGVLTDTTGGSFTVTLPASPLAGSQVVISDAGGSWGTNNLTVARNGETISGSAQDLVCDIDNVSVQLIYDGTTWKVYAQVGGAGGNVLVQSDIGVTVQAFDATILKSADIGVIVQGYDADTVKTGATQTLTNKTIAFSSNTLTGVAPTASPEFTGAIFDNGSVRGNVVAVSALDIDCSAGNYFTKTISANSTFTFSNAPASRSFAFTLELTHTSGAVTWPTEVKWPGDTAPTITDGATSLFVFVTDDGGTRWRGAALVDYTT